MNACSIKAVTVQAEIAITDMMTIQIIHTSKIHFGQCTTTVK